MSIVSLGRVCASCLLLLSFGCKRDQHLREAPVVMPEPRSDAVRPLALRDASVDRAVITAATDAAVTDVSAEILAAQGGLMQGTAADLANPAAPSDDSRSSRRRRRRRH